MKMVPLLFVAVFAVAGNTASAQEKHNYKPAGGYVRDATTALGVARAVLVSIYGEQHIRKQEPLNARRTGDTWVIEGTLHCAPKCLGGTAVLELSALDGRILRVSHGK